MRNGQIFRIFHFHSIRAVSLGKNLSDPLFAFVIAFGFLLERPGVVRRSVVFGRPMQIVSSERGTTSAGGKALEKH